jgi:molybdate transport system substrate-binding protein
MTVARLLLVTLVLLSIGVGVACGGDSDDAASSPAAVSTMPATGNTVLVGDLTVFAAASLTGAFEEIGGLLEDANPELTVAFNFAGSQQLVTQLAEGADADILATANEAQMQASKDGGVIASDPVIFTRNRLAIVVPSDNPAQINAPADLAADDLKLVIANAEVPVGKYALEMLDKLSADPTYGADFRQRVEDNVVSLEDNVKQVVSKVQLGEADAGIVYVTDITPDVAEDVATIEIPAEFNVIAAYPIAAVADGDATLAQAFIDFVLSDTGQHILIKHGFTARE